MEHAPAWLTNSLIYLSAAVLVVPLSKALGLGSIIGYLVAGIAIGPWGLGLVSRVEDVLHFAEFGVVLMLFLVGLELEPKRLWNLRRPIFGWGTAQVLSCAAVLFAIGCAVGAPWRVSLVAALGLALSSTAIALQVFGERNLLRTPSGQAGFSILLFQDVAAIPILAILPLLAGATAAEQSMGGLDRLLEGLKIFGVIGGIVLGGRLALRPVLRWIARSDTPEIFTAAALLLVVAIAALMQFVGLSMALGAFLAGVLLAERIPARARDRHRALQGPLARAVLHRRGHDDRFRRAAREPLDHGDAGGRLHGHQAGGDLRAGQGDGAGLPGAPGVHAAAGAGRRIRLRGVPVGRARRAAATRSPRC